MRKEDVKWNDALSALYGTQIDAQQGEVWQVYLRELNTTNAELTEAIEKASRCDLKPKEWRVTVTDLIRWVEALRKKKQADKADPRKVDVDSATRQFEKKAIELFEKGFSKEYLIDEAWALHGLTDQQINVIVRWIEKLGETK